MNKKILSMAIATVALFSMPAMAQNAEKYPKQCDKKCQSDKKCNKNMQCKPAYNPFEGLNLTEQQQASLKAIPCPKQVMKEARKQANTDNGKRDPKMRAQVAKDIRANYLKQVKSVLTPEQYVQFLENQYVNQRSHKQDMKKNHKKRECIQAKACKQGKGMGKCDKPVCKKANADCKK